MKAKFKKVVRSSFPELDNPYLLNFIIIIKYFLTYQYQCYYLNIEWISFLSVHSSPEVTSYILSDIMENPEYDQFLHILHGIFMDRMLADNRRSPKNIGRP